MSNPNFLAITANMIVEVQRRGCTPVSFVMNRATQAHIANELWQAHRLKMSALGKLWHWMRQGKTVPRLETLHGLGVMDGPQLQDGAVFLQSISVGQPPQEAPGAGSAQNAPAESPFWRREPVAAPEDSAPTLNDLASGGGDRPTASAVLIKALESSEDLAGVVVIRVHGNRDIDMTMNADPLACRGILDKAAQYLYMKGM